MSHPRGERPVSGELEIGGLLKDQPSDLLVQSAFARDLESQLGLHEYISFCDIAHTLVLCEQGTIPSPDGKELLRALLELHDHRDAFEAQSHKGDLVTNREAWIKQRTGHAGWLGCGRARREPVTTGFHLVTLLYALDLTAAIARTCLVMAGVASEHKHSLFVDHTYLQVAQPTTFGHYLLSFAYPLLRCAMRLREFFGRFDICPAGIGASNGSPVHQYRYLLAKELGFTKVASHCRDAMWIADLPIEAVGALASTAITVDRLAEDMMIHSAGEFGYIGLADRHCRASKVMPQKKNPFALAYIRAEANRAIGIQASIAAAARTPSGSMDNRLDAYTDVPEAFRRTIHSARLIGEVCSELSYNEERSLEALEDRAVCATDLAANISLSCSLDYRASYRAVSKLISQCADRGIALAAATPKMLLACLPAEVDVSTDNIKRSLTAAFDLDACIAARSDVGGTAPLEVTRMVKDVEFQANRLSQWARSLRDLRNRQLGGLLQRAQDFSSQ